MDSGIFVTGENCIREIYRGKFVALDPEIFRSEEGNVYERVQCAICDLPGWRLIKAKSASG